MFIFKDAEPSPLQDSGSSGVRSRHPGFRVNRGPSAQILNFSGCGLACHGFITAPPGLLVLQSLFAWGGRVTLKKIKRYYRVHILNEIYDTGDSAEGPF